VPATQVRRSAVLLSLGVKDDWSFDRAFIAMNPAARVIAVDHSVGPAWFMRHATDSLLDAMGHAIRGDARRARKQVDVARNAIDYFRFFSTPHRHIRKRVAARDSASEITLTGLLELAGGGDHDVLLKMDVDGAEYELVPGILSNERRINCLVVEFHRLDRNATTFDDAIAQLLRHFRIVHIHGNNYAGYDAQNDFPDTVEITFVNAALMPAVSAPSRHDYPRPGLDFPNRSGRPDYPLRFD